MQLYVDTITIWQSSPTNCVIWEAGAKFKMTIQQYLLTLSNI